ncbi:MAG: hypothetical protein IJG42_01605 [Muribaculaceae bacterium]|nr:hypothetical protein [Muribaculaceae bacterium]
MKLNSNRAFNLLGVAFMIILIGALMLAAWAGVSKAGIIATAAVVAIIGDFAAIMLLFKYSNEKREVINGFNLDEVRMHRTVLGTSIEVITGVLVALAWALSVKNGLFTEGDGSFSFETLLGMILFTAAIIFTFWDTYTPGDMNNVGKLTNLKQVSLAVHMNRLIALLLTVGMLLSSFPSLRPRNWIWITLATILAVVFIVFRILIRRAK